MFSFSREFVPSYIVLHPDVINERIKRIIGDEGFLICQSDPETRVVEFTVSTEDYSVKILANEKNADLMCSMHFQNRVWLHIMDLVEWGCVDSSGKELPGYANLH